MVGGYFGKLATFLSHKSHGFQALAGYRRPGALLTGAFFVVATIVALLAWTPRASAWEAWDSASKTGDWCRGCHGNFRANGATSLKLGDEAAWGGNMMSIHSTDFLNGDCNACHGDDAGGTGKFPVFMDEANSTVTGSPQAGCMGCHGREEDANTVAPVPQGNLSPGNTGPSRGVGAGLRQAHWAANRTMTHDILGSISTRICADCHGDADPANYTPVAESTVPPHYQPAISATSPTNPCNIPAGSEAKFGTLGLDNDGDGQTDNTGGDADCLINNAPTADAGPNQSVFVLSTVTLDGSLSSDLDSDPLTYAWTFNSVPAGSTLTVLTNPTTVNPTFVPDVPGTYDVQLIVNDGLVDSAPDVVLITTQNSAPVANAGPDQSSPVNGATVSLDGSGSSDVDGDPLTYAWTWVTRPVGSAAAFSNPAIVNPTFVIDVTGTYTAQLIVDDGTVSSTPDVVTITTANTAPVANAGPDQSGLWNDVITLDGSGSTDVDGDTLTYSWTLTSRPAGSAATLSNPAIVNPTFVIDVSGNYVATLVVNDGTADSAADVVSITTDNSAPVANAGSDQSVAQNDPVTLNGSGSTDVDGDTITYSWSILSGPDTPTLNNPTTVNPTFTATGIGTYTVQLIVNDGTVNSAPDTMQVSTTGNTAPVANAGPDQSGFWNDTITLDGSGSSDVDLDPLTYSWSFASKPAGSAAALANPTTVNPSFIIDVSGTYTVQLIVNDGALDSAPDTMVVTTLNSAPVADAGPNQSVYVTDLVTLDGSASSDVDNNPLTYSWSMNSKPAGSTASLSSTTAVSPTFTVDLPGTYVAQLIVNDGTVSSAPETVSVTTLNSTPVANAGVNQTVFVNDTVTLDGSGSSDADFDALTYSWSLTSKPAGSTAALTGPTTVNPTFVADLSGTYVAQLVVNDGTVSSAPDSVTIDTGNTPPVADAGPDQATAGGTVTLDGSGSYDIDLDPLTYSWTFTARPVGSTATLTGATTVNPTFTADLTGTYTVRLIVNDGTVNSIQDTVNIVNTLPGGNQPNIGLAPSSYDFGPVLLGTTQTKNVAIQNTGNDILSVTGLVMVGADFSYSGPALPFSVDRDRQVSVAVTYTPSAAGASAPGTLTVTSNDPDTSTTAFTFNGSGVVGTPDINLPSTTLAFGDVAVGSSKTASVVIQNNGTATLNVSGLSLTGGNADFALVTGAPLSIAAGFQASVQVTYTPSATGADAETLQIVSDDPDESPITAAISGNGIAPTATPDINLPSATLAFGDVAAGSSKTASVVIQNNGTATLNVSGLSLTGGNADFALVTSAPLSIAAGFQASVQVTYTPSATGADAETLQIVSDDPDESPITAAISGNGIAPTATPDINLPSATLAFGDVAAGSSKTASVVIQNNGTATLNVSGLSLTGGNADFALVTSAPLSIAAGFQASVQVTYTPSATGADAETLQIVSDDPDESPITAAISGNGITAPAATPDINLPSATLAFGDAAVGSTLRDFVDIQNVGTADLNVTSLAVTGSGDFVLNNPPATPFTIRAGRQVRVKVHYTASASGAASASLDIGSNDPDEPAVSAALSGNGLAGTPDINLPSATLAFGDVAAGSSKTASVVIQNNGTATLNVSGLSLTGGNADFALVTSAPLSIAAGFQASVQVTYTPSATGADAETLQIVSDDPDESPITAAISGNGITAPAATPDINLPSATLAFGDAAVGSTLRGFVDIQNVGTADLNVTSLAITGSGDFVLSNPPATPFTIRAGRQVRVKVQYSASVTGPASASLDIGSDDPDEPAVSTVLSGNGIAGTPDINLPSATLAFGDVETGSSKTGTLFIQNVGTGPLSVSGLSLTGGNADFTLVTSAPLTIAPGYQASVKVTYTPSATGADAETLQIVSDDPDESPVSVAISANGIAPTATPDINLPSATLAFGDVAAGSSKTASVVIQNNGTATLNVSGLSLTGGNADFALVTSAPLSIAAGFQASVQVTYTPSATGADAETLQIVSDDPDESPVSVAISANGIAPTATPDINLPSATLAFGDVAAGSSKTASVVIQNNGTATLNVSGLSLTGGNADFALVTSAPLSIAAGFQASVQVTYTPSATGADAETLQIVSDDPDESPVSVAISGNGTTPPAGSPDINLPTSSLAYGDVLVGKMKTMSIAIQNVGTANLNVTGLTLTGSGDFTLAAGTPTSFVVAAGYQVTVKVNYNPSAAGVASGSLAIASSDPVDPSLSVSLSGNGVAGVADINLPVVSYDYGDVVVGTTKTASIVIQNPGTADLNVTGLTLTGSGDFTLAAGTPTSFAVAAGRQVTIQVKYTPSATGVVGGTLTVTSDDIDEPSVPVTLTGNGAPAV